MFYKHLSENERNLIDFLFNKGKNSISQIARSLGRNKSTISRELKRNCQDGVYCHEIAESKTIERKKHKYFLCTVNTASLQIISSKCTTSVITGFTKPFIK